VRQNINPIREVCTMTLSGGCLCGAVRYAILPQTAETAPRVADYCHCGQCRKASGAPVSAWLQVEPSQFRLTAGAPSRFESSAHAARWFCPNCGSPVYMTDDEGKSVGITIGTLDEPNLVPPTVHGWSDARLEWLKLVDSLPRYSQSPPYDL